MMKTKRQFFKFFVGYLLLSAGLYCGSQIISQSRITILIGCYFIAIGLLGVVAKFFFFKIPFLSDRISIERSYLILNLVLFVLGVIFIINYWQKWFS